jgi:hypothetical protein
VAGALDGSSGKPGASGDEVEICKEPKIYRLFDFLQGMVRKK